MRKSILAFYSGSLLLLANGLPMHGAEAATLTDALAAAYNNNPTLLAQRALLRQADEGVPQALGGWRPTVQFSGAFGSQQTFANARLLDGAATGVGSNLQKHANTHPRNVDLTVTQQVYNGGKTVAGVSQSENQVQATRAQTLQVEEQVLLSVVQAYMDVVQNQSVLDLNINNEQVLRRQLEATRDRFRVGEVTRTDVAQAEATLATATSDRVQAEGNLEVSRHAYERAVGEPPGLLTPPKERPVLPVSRDEAATLATSNNPSIISAQFAESSAKDGVQLVRSQLLPQVSLVGDLSQSKDAGTRKLVEATATLEAKVTVPLYEGGQIYSQTRQAVETVAQRRHQVDDTRRQIVQTTNQNWETLQSARARVESLTTSVRSNTIAYEGVQQEALVGARTVLDVLNAEQTLFTSRVQLVQAQHDETVSEFAVSADVGNMTAMDLRLPVQLYDFDKHYRAVRDKWIGFSGE